jgi:hypothetical protein
LGLDSLRCFGPPPDSYFKPMWNPRDKVSSFSRSEDFLLGSSLAWAVDCLDGYLGQLARQPQLLEHHLRSAMLAHSKSIQKMFDDAVAALKLNNSYLAAMTYLLIQWRNNLTHVRAKNKLPPSIRNILKRKSCEIKEKHRDLDVHIMLDRFDRREYPKFKEVASLLSATHDFVSEVDAVVVSGANVRLLAIGKARKYFDSLKKLQRLRNVYSVNTDRQKNYVAQVLKECGFESTTIRPGLPSKAFFSFEEVVTWLRDFDEARRVIVRFGT